MKKNSIGLLVIITALFIACQPAKKESSYKTPEIKLKSNIMTPEVLWSFGRIGEVSLSPDKKTVLYAVTYFNIKEDRSYRDIYTMNVDGTNKKQLTNTSENEYNVIWRPDGKKIAFLSSRSGSMQAWEMNTDGTGRKQISDIKGGIGGFNYSPDQSKIAYLADVKKKSVADMHPDLPKANARVIDDLMYRHWDRFVDAYTHIFVADFNGKSFKKGKDILEGEEWEAPMRPFGGMEEVVWTNDSKSVIYSCRKKKGVAYTISTNSDLYQYNLKSGKTSNLTLGMMGYDLTPVISPDGKKLAWTSMERDGYESDKHRLFVMDLDNPQKRTYFTKNFDQNADHLAWTADSKSLYFISDWHATDEIYKLNLTDGKINKITEGVHNYKSVISAGAKLVTTRVSMSKPKEIYVVDAKTGKDTEVSNVNKPILSQLKMGKVEKRWVKTTDNKQMAVWVIYPPNFDKNKKYPALLYCQGGPQGTVSQFWSYRWNFQMMAANDYIIVAPNRRGLPGFGQEWLEQISGDYGGQNMKDYLSAIDNVKKEPYVDENRLGAVGASYGGFSVYWLAGNHNKRFKAFISHDGMFNFEAQYLETEEMWFVNWDLGGPFWDKKNKIAQRSYANSPHKFVEKWDTPILVIHGGKDYRIVDTQGMQAFNAAKLRGVPAQLLHLPEENHWVLKAQNGILWQRTFFNWLDKWLKE